MSQARKVPEALFSAAGKAPQRVIIQLVLPKEVNQYESQRTPEMHVQTTLGRASRGTVGIQGTRYVVGEVGRDGLQRLEQDPIVQRVIPDRLMRAFLPESTRLLHVPEAWSRGARGNGTAIAVLDTGVSSNHPFFQNRVVSEACFSSTVDASGSSTLCPNGRAEQFGKGAAAPCNSQTVSLSCVHGTHVAGIAAGANGDRKGQILNGVAPGANIVAVNVFSRFRGEDACGESEKSCVSAWTSDVLRGLLYIEQVAVNARVAAINLSLGSGKWEVDCDAQSPYTEVIGRLTKIGIAVVVAAGNDGFAGAVTEPACVSSAITVSAVGKTGVIDTAYANRSTLVDLLAPGTQILSSAADAYVKLDGTSMAAPHVAGLFSLLRAEHSKASVFELLSVLKLSGQEVRDPQNKSLFFLPNAQVAMTAMNRNAASPSPDASAPGPNPAPAPPPAVTTPDPHLVGCGTICVQLGKHTRRVIFALANRDPVTEETLKRLQAVFGERARLTDIGDGKLSIELSDNITGEDVDRARRSVGDDTRVFPDRPMDTLKPGGRIQIR
jgi:subtilisin family serine protease